MTALFRYTAREASGRMARGALEADTREEALARLHGRRLTPLSLSLADAQDTSPARLDDKAARDLSRTLAQLLKSGLSFAQALKFSSEELQGQAAAAAMRLREATERGERASTALEQFSGAQARLLSGVILAGETSGKLAEALEVAAATFSRATELRTRVSTAMIYPAFVVIATLATLSSFMFFVVPTMAGAFEGSEAQLPSETRSLLAASAWLQANGLYLALALAAVAALIWTSRPIRRLLADAIDAVLTSPVGLGIAPRLDLAGFSGLAALSFDAGVPSAAAFEAAAGSVRSGRLKVRLKDAVSAIRMGERPSAAVEQRVRPPKSMTRLMQVGEETGDLGASMRQVADLLSSEAEQRMQRLGAIAGPVITMALGGVVASVVLSLFLGLLAMSDLASQ
jgi:general secretion pathway protein F